ncbi:ADP-ribosyltransferase [Bacillus cereus group sp. N6]|uniref:ADP-ribosyltransferase n=1 Tax=Bacillus cereus group sp. N6 TaxID=2794583 RepID=UPI0018F69841|nr:ADP-ribosyltransferase [Bacillus cereus group sp. N6]MBJ8113812.1 ADP-ribosyltransferase [Bacillus cereus group sp. N6]
MNQKNISKVLLATGIAASSLFFVGSATSVAATTSTSNTQQVNYAVFEEYGKKWLASLNADQKNAITYYTGQNYTDINYYLRSNKKTTLPGSSISKAELDKKISFIDSAINKATLQEDITVYRNTGEQELNAAKDFLQHTFGLDLNSLDGIKDFDKYINKAISLVNNSINKTNTALAYTSTSLQKNGVFSGSAIRMEIKVPKGTHAPYVDSISKYKGEKELLLPRGSKFKIIGASTIQENGHNILVIRATLVS